MSSYKPRTTGTSIRAGIVPPLDSHLGVRRTKSESEKVADRRRKFREAEEQLEKKAHIGIDQPADTRIVSVSMPTTTMTQNKIIAPSARDAPRFSSRRPQELRRFLRCMEDLYKEAGVTGDEEKKDLLGKYADPESEEEWRALESFPKGHTWEDYKKELIANYPEAAEAERGKSTWIRQICRDTKDIRLGELAALYAFRRQFMTETKKLSKDPPAMANRELVELFMKLVTTIYCSSVAVFGE